MLKLLGKAKDGNGHLLTAIIDDRNIDKLRQGNPLWLRSREWLPELNPQLDILLAWSADLKKSSEDLIRGVEIGKVIGDFEPPHPLTVLVGLPKSGKSTLVKQEYLPKGYSIVCPDNVRVAIHGERFVERAEPFVWATVYAMVDSLLLSGNKVVVDATHTTRKRREPWTKRGAVFRVVDTPAEECIRRAKAEGDEVIVPIIESAAKKWEPVGADEGIILTSF
jgi:predicted kinase